MIDRLGLPAIVILLVVELYDWVNPFGNPSAIAKSPPPEISNTIGVILGPGAGLSPLQISWSFAPLAPIWVIWSFGNKVSQPVNYSVSQELASPITLIV